MNTNLITQLEQFRLEVYHSFDHRADAAMDVLDALTGNTSARSVVELSLAPDFRRTYSSVYAAIGACFTITKPEHRRRREETLLRLIAAYLAQSQRRKFWLFGMDATAIPRSFARTLPDRGFVHCANPIGGNKPITIGHQYSLLAYLPDKLPGVDPAWIVPLLWRRIATQETEIQVGVAQVATLLADERLPFHYDLGVQVEDSRYSVAAFLSPLAQHANLVTITRLRGTRTCIARRRRRQRPGRRGIRPGMGSRLTCRMPPPGVHQRRPPRPATPAGGAGRTPCRSRPGTTCSCAASGAAPCIRSRLPCCGCAG